MEKRNYWRRLDNTAKIFPLIANENLSNVYRISVTLQEQVEPELLSQALKEVLPRMEGFGVKLRRGIFWYYFEENKRVPQVQKESGYPCRYIDPHGNQKFLFRVTYYERRINLEMFHALTDGLGAVTFLKSLTGAYLNLKRGGQPDKSAHVHRKEDQTVHFSMEDSYLKNYRNIKRHTYSSAPAYRLMGNYLPLGVGKVIHGYVSVKELKAVSHRYGVSITKYLAAALIWSVWKGYLRKEPDARAVVINLPINLRAFFQSETMANFFAVTMIGYLFKHKDCSFEDVLNRVSSQMDEKLVREKLEESISYNVSRELKWYVRVVPLFIKWMALNVIFRFKDRAYTITCSNIGPIRMSPEDEKEIERFTLMLGVSRRQPMKCGVCSYGDEMAITFTSVFADNILPKCFFKKLKEDGLRIRLEGNGVSGLRNKSSYPKIRKILIFRRGGEAKASRIVHRAEQEGVHAIHGLSAYIHGRKSLKQELVKRLHI